jgi:hypothetical protein
MVHNRIYGVLPEIPLGRSLIILGGVHEFDIEGGKLVQAELDNLPIGRVKAANDIRR